MREIKFRAWDGKKMLSDRQVIEIAEGYMNINDAPNVMQYTGLKDKNGKEIYEGDIVCLNGCHNYEIKFGEGTFDSGIYRFIGFYLYDHKKNEQEEDEFLVKNGCVHSREVIGNIYENPDLMKTL